MGQRFNNLQFAYEALVLGNFNVEQLPANNPIRKYYEWRSDPEKRQIGDRVASSKPGSLELIGIIPFGQDHAADTGFAVKASSRSITKASGIAALNTQFDNAATLPAGYIRNPGFTPAKCIFAQEQSGTTQTSVITGKRYTKTQGPSWTIPIGQGSTREFEIEVQTDILNHASLDPYVVTFTPERMRQV